MQDYSINLIIQTIWNVSRILLDIGIMFFIIHYTIKIIKNNTRTVQIFKGIFVIILIDLLAKLFNLKTVSSLTSMVVNWGFLGIVIIFQPEIRSFLEKLGKSNNFNKFNILLSDEKEKLSKELYDTLVILSEKRVGALISIEQMQSMKEYIDTGIKLNSDVNAELLTSIFMTTTPLHDGAVIINGMKIVCASAYFPSTSQQVISNKYGSRHRAALGISEVSDAITFVVSEETGTISVAEKGRISKLNHDELKKFLNRVIKNEEIEITRNDNKVLIDDENKLVITNNIPLREMKIPENKNNRKLIYESKNNDDAIEVLDNTNKGDNNG